MLSSFGFSDFFLRVSIGMFLGEGWRGIAKTGDQCALKRVQVAATPLALCREISRDFFVTGRGDGGGWI